MADNYEVKRYSRFWWGIIDPETKLYVKGEVGPYGLALFKTRQEAENKIAELEEPVPIDEVWTNGSGPGYYETSDYIKRDLENAGISFKEYDDGNFTIFAVKNLNAQEADEIIFNWVNDYERKEGKSETSFRISNDFLFENKESSLEEGYKLVKSNKTIDELKSLVDNLFNELKKLEKPEEYTTGGEYYGRTQLLRSHSNVLDLVTNYTHTKRDSYDFNKSWSDGTYCIKIGGAYKYSDYKNLLKPLLDAFNYKVVSGFGISEDLLIDDTICSLIDDYGTNYSVYGIGFDKNLGNREIEEDLEDLKFTRYKYLVDVYNMDDDYNVEDSPIERKLFRSRPEVDRFVDAIPHLYDIKIDNGEVIKLDNGKLFVGSYWKVIRKNNKEEESLKEEIKKQPNVEYKGFTIEHSPMGLVVDFTPDNLNKEHEMEIDGYFIHSPYYLQSNSDKEKIYLPLFCEDEYGHVINFETLDQAKKYINDWMVTKKGRIKLKGWKKDECHFEILPEFREQPIEEKLTEGVAVKHGKKAHDFYRQLKNIFEDFLEQSEDDDDIFAGTVDSIAGENFQMYLDELISEFFEDSEEADTLYGQLAQAAFEKPAALTRWLEKHLNESLKEAIEEKEFDATFHDGPNSDRQERVIIKAKDLDDAVEKAYRMPQVKRYSDVIVGERTTGLTSYIVAFYVNMVFNGKVENRVSEERLVFNAENEAQAKAAYNKKYLGKYYRWLYPSKDNVLSEPPTDIQGGKYGRVFDVYQFGATPLEKADNAADILGESLKEGLSDLIDELKKAIANGDKKAEAKIRKQLEKVGMDIATQNTLIK